MGPSYDFRTSKLRKRGERQLCTGPTPNGTDGKLAITLDNNVWNFLHDRNIDLAVELPRERFSIFITREVEIEALAIPATTKAALKEFIARTIADCAITTTWVFGFDSGTGPGPQRFGGFGQGVRQSRTEGEFYEAIRRLYLTNKGPREEKSPQRKRRRRSRGGALHSSHCRSYGALSLQVDLPKLARKNFVNFSDLGVLWFPLEGPKKLPPIGWLNSHVLNLVHVQSWLLFDEELLIRGGVTIGPLAKSYGQTFGPGLIRAYELESQHAKYPRILVDDCVLEEFRRNPGLCVNDPETDAGYMKEMLRKDVDGKLFVDYLRVMEYELDDPAAYPWYMAKLGAFIEKRLEEFADAPSVRAKYEWLKEYHAKTLKRTRRPTGCRLRRPAVCNRRSRY